MDKRYTVLIRNVPLKTRQDFRILATQEGKSMNRKLIELMEQEVAHKLRNEPRE